MQARQRAQLTGTNRSFDLIALVAKARRARKRAQRTEDGRQRTDEPLSDAAILKVRKTSFASVGRQTSEDRRRELFPSSVVRSPSSEPFFAGLVAFARRQDPIPSRTRPSNALAPMVLCLKTWESRSSPGLPRTDPTLPLQTQNQRKAPKASVRLKRNQIPGAGWSSPVARQAHNLKAAGSNPAPATKITLMKTSRSVLAERLVFYQSPNTHPAHF